MVLTGQLEKTPLLEVLQVIAYSRRSGLLLVSGPSTQGTLLFDRGNLVCALSTSTRALLAKAAQEDDAGSRDAVRRVQALVTLAELFELKEGAYQFVKLSEPVPELEGFDVRPFYQAGSIDTGDLLLILAKSMDREEPTAPPSIAAEEVYPEKRRHPRFGPTAIKAELSRAGRIVKGYLTNLSLGGAFFHSNELPEIDSVCELRFTLPRGIGPCQAAAKVVWARVHVTDARRGVGLSFEYITDDSSRRLSKYLEDFRNLAADMDFEA